jgi:pantetheine-phosphate adenylyltransferase
MKVCVGGTFNKLHRGHKMLLKKAFEYAGENGFVYIGLSRGSLVKTKKNVKSYDIRKDVIEQFLTDEALINRVRIVPIEKKYGLTLIDDYDAIVVSPETKKIADEINHKRVQMGKKKLKIISIPYILSEDGKPISSTRIIDNEIDENGNIIQED